MATKIIWGASQELEVWGVECESGSEWRVRDSGAFERMIQCRLDVKFMKLTVDVIEKEGYKNPSGLVHASSSTHAASGVTNGAQDVGETGDYTGSTPEAAEQCFVPCAVDWDSLVIEQDESNDGDPTTVVDETTLYQAMGFEANDKEAAEMAALDYVIPCMSTEMDIEFKEAAIPVDDMNALKHLLTGPEIILICQ